MGMNFKVGLFNETVLFWVVVAVIIAIAPITVGIAKKKDVDLACSRLSSGH